MASTLTKMTHCDAVGRGIHAINKAAMQHRSSKDRQCRTVLRVEDKIGFQLNLRSLRVY